MVPQTSQHRLGRLAAHSLLVGGLLVGACGSKDEGRDDVNDAPTTGTTSTASASTAVALNDDQIATLRNIVSTFATQATAGTGVPIEEEEQACLVSAMAADSRVTELLALAGTDQITETAQAVIDRASTLCLSATKISQLNQ